MILSVSDDVLIESQQTADYLHDVLPANHFKHTFKTNGECVVSLECKMFVSKNSYFDNSKVFTNTPTNSTNTFTFRCLSRELPWSYRVGPLLKNTVQIDQELVPITNINNNNIHRALGTIFCFLLGVGGGAPPELTSKKRKRGCFWDATRHKKGPHF